MSAPAHVPEFYNSKTLGKEPSTSSLNSALREDVSEVVLPPDGHDISDEVVNDDEIASRGFTSGPAGPSGQYKPPKGRNICFYTMLSLTAFTN